MLGRRGQAGRSALPMLLYHVCYNNNMIKIVTCACGSSDSLVRNFLHSINYPEWMSIQINKGREKSIAVLNLLPSTPEKEMLRSFLKNASKWAVIIGYNGKDMKWSDIAHNGPKSRIEAEYVVKVFSPLGENGEML